MDFLELEQIASTKNLDSTSVPRHRLAILGSNSTQYLNKALKLNAAIQGIALDVYEADYDSIEIEILNEESHLYEYKPETTYIAYSAQTLSSRFYTLTSDEQASFCSSICQKLDGLIETINGRIKTNILIANFESYNDNIFGNFSNKSRLSLTNQLKRLNVGLMDLAEQHRNVFILDINSLYAAKGKAYAFSPGLYVLADLNFSLEFTIDVSSEIIKIIGCFLGRFNKCLILDLDNTTWGGVIGDDGIDNIEIGSLGVGKAYTKFQHWAKQLKQRGVALAVNSKNSDHVAREPFEKHPEMVLRMDDFSVFLANWDNKVNNIRLIQQVLNIGFDSMVFVDDNPAEREIVRTNIPEVVVPELPDEPAEYVHFLAGLNLFETTSYSQNDASRTQQYREEAQRVRLKNSLTDIGEYLESLNMTADLRPFEPRDVARIAQLSQRSNQYNLRTVRYTEQDVEHIMNDSSYLTFSMGLRDKFGDYGLISLLSAVRKQGDAPYVFVENWLMSCRVLKRDVEYYLLNNLVGKAIEVGATHILGEYIPTPKNKLVEDHYRKLGFHEQRNNLWRLDIKGFEPFETKIR